MPLLPHGCPTRTPNLRYHLSLCLNPICNQHYTFYKTPSLPSPPCPNCTSRNRLIILEFAQEQRCWNCNSTNSIHEDNSCTICDISLDPSVCLPVWRISRNILSERDNKGRGAHPRFGSELKDLRGLWEEVEDWGERWKYWGRLEKGLRGEGEEKFAENVRRLVLAGGDMKIWEVLVMVYWDEEREERKMAGGYLLPEVLGADGWSMSVYGMGCWEDDQ